MAQKIPAAFLNMGIHFSYNFVKSGPLFFYRGIFSGLSNETMGAALYFTQSQKAVSLTIPYCTRFQYIIYIYKKIKAMNKPAPGLIATIVKYDALLQRYARRLVKNQYMAAALVKEVFELVYDLNGFNTTAAELRQQFRSYTLKVCEHWLRTQALQNLQKN